MELDTKQIADAVLASLGKSIAGGLVGRAALDEALEAVGKKLDVGVNDAVKQVEERIKGTYMENLLAQIKAQADRMDKLDLAFQERQKKAEAAPHVFNVARIRDFAEEYGAKGVSSKLELTKEEHDALLAKTLATGQSGSFGAAIQPYVMPGIMPPVLKRLVIENLFERDTISVPTFLYVRESSRTNNAATVSEGGAKPESAVVLSSTTGKVETLAHQIPMTNQLAADVPGSQSYIEAMMIRGLQDVSETQLLTGDGVSPNLTGITTAGNFTAYTGPAIGADWTFAPATSANTNLLDKIAHMIFSQLFVANFTPTGIVIHGANVLGMLMIKSTTGDYVKALGGDVVAIGPDGVMRLFGIPVAMTNNSAVLNNKAIVGDFSKLNAQIYDREQITVATGFIADDFQKNQFRIRVERRMGMCIRRPAAFIFG